VGERVDCLVCGSRQTSAPRMRKSSCTKMGERAGLRYSFWCLQIEALAQWNEIRVANGFRSARLRKRSFPFFLFFFSVSCFSFFSSPFLTPIAHLLSERSAHAMASSISYGTAATTKRMRPNLMYVCLHLTRVTSPGFRKFRLTSGPLPDRRLVSS